MLDKESELKDLKFICPNKNDQIIEEIMFSEIKDHIENCDYLNQTKCIQCGLIGQEKDLINHIKECPDAIILCEYCNEESQRKFYKIHLDNCEKINTNDTNPIDNDKSLEEKIENEYVKLTENKIDNLSNDEFVVSSEKEKNVADIMMENNENQFEKEIFKYCNSCSKISEENNVLKEKLEKMESSISFKKCKCSEENAILKGKLAILEKHIENYQKGEVSASSLNCKKIVCSFILFGMFIQQFIILYLIKYKFSNLPNNKEFDSFDNRIQKQINYDYLKIDKILNFNEELENVKKEMERIKSENIRNQEGKKMNFIEELEILKKEIERIKNENRKKTDKQLEKIFAEKNINFSLVNNLLKNRLQNIEKIFEISQHELNKDYFSGIKNFHSSIKDKTNLIYFINLKKNHKKLTIGFYQNIHFSEKDLKSYKFFKDKNSFILISDNKFILADENKDSQFFFIDNYFFIVGFNNGGGLYLRYKTLSLNLNKLSSQYKVSESDFEYLDELSGENLYQYLENMQVFKIHFDIEYK